MALAMPVPTAQSPLGDFAQWYAALGLPVCPAIGKAPKITKNGYYDATTDKAQITAWWQEHPYANIAVRMGGLWWTLDVDVHNGGAESLEALLKDHDDLPLTVTSETGSQNGSVHMIWRVPEGVTIPTGHPWKGIDVQGDPSCIIVPPSLHPDTMKRYQWRQTLSPADLSPVEAPEWLVELVLSQAASSPGKNGVPFDPQAIIPKGQRENTFLSMLGGLYARGFSAATLRQLLDTENVRCDPPMTAEELDYVIKRLVEMDTKKHPGVNRQQEAIDRANPPQINTASWGFTNTGAQPTAANDAHWRSSLFVKVTKKSLELYPNEYNITQILQNSDYWQKPENALWYDVLLGRHMMDTAHIDRAQLVKIAHWFGGVERMPITSFALLEECLHARCEENKRDRIALWLNGLPPWDGTERLETWLIQCAHAEDDEIGYTRHISRRLLLSMIARGLNPGCQYREVVVLEGPENIGKSHIVEALASKEFFIVLSMNLEAKEAHMMLQRAWLAELADLDSMNRTEETRLKAFITMEEDTYVPKYRNESISVPRRAIFVGTTNDRSYLKSLSGNTRFLPLWLPGPVDLDALRTMREQLFAEAKHVFHASGEGWWVMPEDVQVEADTRRETRRVKNPYEVPLNVWLQDKIETTWAEIAQYFLELKTPEAWKDRSLQMQIGSALRAIGFETLDEWRPELNGGKGGKWHGWTRKTWQSTDAFTLPFEV